ncbi:glycosyl transferase [Streptomyces lucensis JCM 4490]|uniref:Glycosyl transferase n=1 Tax=Streptomyces lucensis JCM 4490 TaxID=1306176 RepID=A0A918MY36_9ACTN|nr:nucleotide disphospho-sugar-binding domain-containing protein [Streptomyces lucensis]GGW82191.1 glycosyl transferase [Streptomyces lucensis JCM 4490]
MRVLFIPLAAASHYYPMVPLAWALRAAGHEVCVAAQPAVADAVVRSGMQICPVGASFDLLGGLGEAQQELRRETGRSLAGFGEMTAIPEDVRRRFVAARNAAHTGAAAAMAGELVAFAGHWRPDVIVGDVVALAGPLLAGVLDVPLVYQAWGPQLPAMARFPGHGAPVETWPGELRALYERFGVPPRPVAGALTVDPCPPSLHVHELPHRLVTRFVPYNGSAVIPDWLRTPPRRPRVGVSWSVSNFAHLAGQKAPLATVVEALDGLDADLVVTAAAQDRDHLGPVPAGVRVEEGLPLNLLAATCSAVVDHAGAGTMLTVAAAGVPQVMLPQEPGQLRNAETVAAVGAGILIRGPQTDPARIRTAVEDLLTEGHWTEAARKLRDENAAQATPAQAARVIADLVAART